MAHTGSRGNPHLEHGRPLASFGFDLNDAPAGTVTFYQAAVAPAAAAAAPATTAADEIVAATEGCVQRLLGDGVAALAASRPAFDESDEPALPTPGPGKKVSAGIVLVDEQGRLTIREPTNHFGGYKHTYAKGRLDRDETPARRPTANCSRRPDCMVGSSVSSETSTATPGSHACMWECEPAG